MLAKKLHFLPITAIAFSISGQPWIHHYIQARRHLKLPISGNFLHHFSLSKLMINYPMSLSLLLRLRSYYENFPE